MSDGERGGVEATAREQRAAVVMFGEKWRWFLGNPDHHDAFLREVDELAAALRAAPPSLERSRLEGNAIGQPTSVVTHDSEGRGMKDASAKRVVEVDFSLDDAKALMRHLQTLGNFDEFLDDREADRLNEDAAFQIRDFVRARIVVRDLGAAPPDVGRAR